MAARKTAVIGKRQPISMSAEPRNEHNPRASLSGPLLLDRRATIVAFDRLPELAFKGAAEFTICGDTRRRQPTAFFLSMLTALPTPRSDHLVLLLYTPSLSLH